MTSPHKLMKNIWMKVFLKYQNSTILQRKDIAYLIPKVAKQWKLQSNGHLTYPFHMCCILEGKPIANL